MAAMFNQRPKGLFGNMGQQASAPPIAQQAMPPQGMAMPQQEATAAAHPKRPGFNDPGGWGERLYNIGGIMRDNDNGQTMANYQQLQMQRSREAQAAQQATQDRENKFGDWRRQYDYERANPAQSQANTQYFDDNAGNRYAYDPATGSQRLIFTDPNDKQFIQDGQLVTVPNVVRQGQQAQAPATLPADFGFDAPSTPNMANTPAPGLNPTSLSAAQYQAIVAVKGKAATDAWAARNGVRIEGR